MFINDFSLYFKEMKSFRDAWHGQCNFTLHYEGLIEQLREEKFDAAFSEPICLCGYGKHDRDIVIIIIFQPYSIISELISML